MGDAEPGPGQLSVNSQLRVEFRGATVTSDAGLLLPRELDEHLGPSALIERHLADPRTGRNRQFPLSDLFRQSIYSRLAGYEDTNDAERLAEDQTFRMLASRARRETSVALTSTLHWFETEVLADELNYQGLSRLNYYHPLFVFNQEGDCSRRQAPAGRRPQCRRMGRGAPPHHPPAPESGTDRRRPRRRGLRPSGGLWPRLVHP